MVVEEERERTAVDTSLIAESEMLRCSDKPDQNVAWPVVLISLCDISQASCRFRFGHEGLRMGEKPPNIGIRTELGSLLTPSHTHTNTHAHTYTHTYTQTLTCTLTYTHTHTHTHNTTQHKTHTQTLTHSQRERDKQTNKQTNKTDTSARTLLLLRCDQGWGCQEREWTDNQNLT